MVSSVRVPVISRGLLQSKYNKRWDGFQVAVSQTHWVSSLQHLLQSVLNYHWTFQGSYVVRSFLKCPDLARTSHPIPRSKSLCHESSQCTPQGQSNQSQNFLVSALSAKFSFFIAAPQFLMRTFLPVPCFRFTNFSVFSTSALSEATCLHFLIEAICTSC